MTALQLLALLALGALVLWTITQAAQLVRLLLDEDQHDS